MREKGATFQNYMRAEMLKYKHTAVGKLTILMPLLCIAMSAVLTHQYFAVDGYNWWYTGMYTGFLALVCGIISEKEKKMGNRAVYSLPCDMKKLWDAKVCYGLLISGGAMLLLTVGIIVVAFFLETQLQVHFILRPSLSEQLVACVLLWLSFCWQIPWCLFLAQTIGRIPMLILHFVGTEIMTIILSLSPIYMFFPGAIGARMMCPLLNVMPNGLPAQTGEMTFAPRLINPTSIPIGIAAAVLWFLLIWGITRIWYQRRVEKV